MKKIIIILFLISFALITNAKNGETKLPISGAFGIELGKPYEEYNETLILLEDEEIKEPYRNFTNYRFWITQKEKKAYYIYASYQAESIKNSINEFEILKTMLIEKYKEDPQNINFFKEKKYDELFEWRNKNRKIIISRKETKIKITYMDLKLYEKAQREKIEKEIKTSNKKAL